MAQQLTCDMCQDEPAAVMQSSLVNGETIAVGDNCMPLFCLAVVTAIVEGMDPDTLATWAPVLAPAITLLLQHISGTPADAPEPAQGSLDGCTCKAPGGAHKPPCPWAMSSAAGSEQESDTGREKADGQEARPRPARQRKPPA